MSSKLTKEQMIEYLVISYRNSVSALSEEVVKMFFDAAFPNGIQVVEAEAHLIGKAKLTKD